MPIDDLAQLVAEAAADGPDRLAVVEAAGRRRAWRPLDAQIGRVSTGLGRLGIVVPQRVLLCVGNRIEFVTTYLGVLRTQAIAVPVNPGSSAADLARMISDSGARVVVADAATVERVREAVGIVGRALAGERAVLDDALAARAVVPRVVVVGAEPAPGETSYDALVAERGAPVPSLPDPEKLAAVRHTAGTPAAPRQAMLPPRAPPPNLCQVARTEPRMMHGDDVVLCVLPLLPVYALNGVLGSVLRSRAKLVLAERFHPGKSLDLIQGEACSVVPAAPPVFAHWLRTEHLRDRLGSVRLVLSGSAPLAPEVVAGFQELTGIPVHQGYGLTEAAPVVTSTLLSDDPGPGSLGAPLPGVEVRVVDETGAVDDEDPGEIQIRGANLFSGYWPDGADGPGADGWWATGDIGYRDHAGDLFLVDRRGELVVVSGFNVYPREVEGVIRDLPGVTETAVIGVQDDQTGSAVVAYVVAPGVPDAEDAVRRHCAERLARFKQPARIEVVEHLPVTATGKVEKGRLRLIERRRALGLVE